MALQIGDTAPDFEAETTEGKIRFHDWIGDHWVVLFSHPKDFTPVCTTELGTMARLKPEFDKRNVKIIGLSVDPVDNHKKWAGDIKDVVGFAPNYPMIGDTDLKDLQALRHAAGKHERHLGRPHAGRQPDRAQRLRHRAGQEGQAGPGLPDDHRPQFRRGAARRSIRCSSPPSTASRRRRTGNRARTSSSPAPSPTTRPRSSIRKAGRRRSLISASCRSRGSKFVPVSALITRARLRPRSLHSAIALGRERLQCWCCITPPIPRAARRFAWCSTRRG